MSDQRLEVVCPRGVNEGDMMTMDVREDRVRVMVDGAGVVTQPPSVG